MKKKRFVKRGLVSLLTVAMLATSVNVGTLTVHAETESSKLVCESEEHSHVEDCYTQNIICELEESEEHAHEDGCYEDAIICELEEHTHGDSCYEAVISEEVQEEDECTCNTETEVHTEECPLYEEIVIGENENEEGATTAIRERVAALPSVEEAESMSESEKDALMEELCAIVEELDALLDADKITMEEYEELWLAVNVINDVLIKDTAVVYEDTTYLPAPTGLTWETYTDGGGSHGIMAKWNAVEGADKYWIMVYKDGTEVVLDVFATDLYCTTTREMMNGGNGTYTFKVSALRENDDWENDNLPFSEVSSGYVYDVNLTKLPTPTGLEWETSTLPYSAKGTWEPVENAVSYTVRLCKYYEEKEQWYNPIGGITDTSYDFTNNILGGSNGYYYFEVYAKGDNLTYSQSDTATSETLYFTAHYHTYNDVYTYDEVNHWKLCSDSDCPETDKGKKDEAEHVYDNDEDSTCDTCGYVRPIITGITVSPSTPSVSVGETQQFSTEVSVNHVVTESETVTWSVAGNGSSLTTIDNNGNLTIGADETATSLTVTVTSARDTSKYAQATISVTPASIENATVTLSNTDNLFYDGNAKNPVVTVKIGSVTLTENTHYTVKYTNTNGGEDNLTNAGTVTVTVAGTGNYTGIATQKPTFVISIAAISPSVTMQGWTYGNTASVPVVTGNTGNGTETFSYKVKDAEDNTYTSTKPSDAGEYTVKVVIAGTSNTDAGEATADFTITKATPTLSAPTAKTLIYTGDALELVNAGSTTGGELQYSLNGTSYSTTIPKGTNAGDYTVYYKVVGGTNYEDVAGGSFTVTINNAPNPSNMPGNTMSPAHSVETVGDIELPTGWEWEDADKAITLEDDVAKTATAVYTGADAINYVTTSVEITITRSSCDHERTEVQNAVTATCQQEGYTGDTVCLDCDDTIASGTVTSKVSCSGGTATCKSPALCSTCGNPHGNINPNNHSGGTEVRGTIPATETEDGYTGDTYCLGCGEMIKAGSVIPKKGTGSGDSGSSESNDKDNDSSDDNSGDSGNENAPSTTIAPAPQQIPTTQKYVVQKGDTLSKIAEIYGCTVNDIVALNSELIKNPDLIYPGWELTIPIGGLQQEASSEEGNNIYVVQSGDTLSSIAKKYGCRWREIYALNKDIIADPDKIRVGWKLKIPKK